MCRIFFFFQAEDGIRDDLVTGVQTCALPISRARRPRCRPAPRASRARARLWRGCRGGEGGGEGEGGDFRGGRCLEKKKRGDGGGGVSEKMKDECAECAE